MRWKNRIVGTDTVPPDQLLANPDNYRLHPRTQQKVMAGILDEIGWIQDVIVNKTTGHMIDGHLRVELALRESEPCIPVKYVELTEDEERKALAVFDPISALADEDAEIQNRLIESIETIEHHDLAEFLADRYTDLDPDDKGSQTDAKQTLANRFIVPPFSLLDARQGYWQERKKAWLGLGIQSELGREGELTYSISSQPPSVYEFKNALEKEQGRSISWQEFADTYPEEIAYSGTSIFDPVLCEVIYTWFTKVNSEILDPFAGGSVRGITASWTGHQYTGIELRSEQVSANRSQADQILSVDNKPIPVWINADSRNMDECLPAGYECDLIFSCPPYADLEQYSTHPADLSNMEYGDFLEAYRYIIASACQHLKDNRFAVWVVGEVRDRYGKYYGLVPDTIQAFKDAGLSYYNELILATRVGANAITASRALASSRKTTKNHQNVLVFTNADDPDKAVGQIIKGLSSEIASHFNEHRMAFEAMRNVLVFAKGNPKAAADEFGEPAPMDLAELDI